MELFIDPLLDGWQPEDVIWEVAIKEGYGLTARIEPVSRHYHECGHARHRSRYGAVFLDLLGRYDSTRQQMEALQLSVDDLFICRDVALDDTLMANLALNCRLKTI